MDSEPAKKAKKKPRASKILPSARVRLEKQLDVLRGYAALGGLERSVVTNAQLAEVVELTASTISLCNPFFADVGLIHKQDSGHTPSESLASYHRALEFDDEDAAHKLAPLLEKAWFWDVLRPRLSMRTMTMDAAVQALAQASEAGPHHKPQLRLVLDYLGAAGLVSSDGDQLSLRREQRRNLDALPPEPERKPPPKAAPSSPDLGVIRFHLMVNVSLDELRTWGSDRISAFFAGVGQVMSASGKDSIESQ